MKYIIVLLLLVGCTSNTQYGKCIGLNGQEDPKLEYEYSAFNIGVGLVFVETIIVPLVVAFDELKCPVSSLEELRNK
jgi:hypothetical protein